MSDTIDQQAADQRAAYISGLRKLADWMEQHPEVPLPHTGSTGDMLFIGTIFDDHEELARLFANALPRPIAKEVRGDALDLKASFDGLNVCVILERDAVCRRVVTGTREVTKWVKDPKQLEEIPEVEITETEEIVEWVCGSVLAPSTGHAELQPVVVDGGA